MVVTASLGHQFYSLYLADQFCDQVTFLNMALLKLGKKQNHA